MEFFEPMQGGYYPDNSCCFETYTSGKMLEMETLGELMQLESDEFVSLEEEREVYPAEAPPDARDEAGLEAALVQWIQQETLKEVNMNITEFKRSYRNALEQKVRETAANRGWILNKERLDEYVDDFAKIIQERANSWGCSMPVAWERMIDVEKNTRRAEIESWAGENC